MVDLTITISVIIALCAIVSPILVAIINNHYTIKMKKIEITKEYRLQAIQNYTRTLESFYQYPIQENRIAYEAALGAALLYVPENLHQSMIHIDKQLVRTLREENNPELANTICILCASLQNIIDV